MGLGSGGGGGRRGGLVCVPQMSWWPSFLTGGIDVAAEEQRAADLDKQLAALNADALARGVWTQEQYNAAEVNRAASTGDLDYSSQVLAAFGEGAVEGLQAELNYSAAGVKRALNLPASWLWKALPWWVWVGGLGVLVWYLGGFTWLRGALAKR